MFKKGQKRTKEFEEKRLANLRSAIMGDKHDKWKGENAGYRAKHMWIEKQRGKPYYCEHCKRSDLPHRQYHWANISGLYKRDIADYIRLCVHCHAKFDKANGHTWGKQKNKI